MGEERRCKEERGMRKGTGYEQDWQHVVKFVQFPAYFFLDGEDNF